MNEYARRLPLSVVGGFLGAGKTTLLRHWLRHAQGRRVAVLVNDFGALNIDAELIASAHGETIALTNGCVCCSIGDDLTGALIRIIEASPPFDAVVIEASGVADPWRIAQIGLADPALRLESVIVLVDAAAVLDQSADVLLADSLTRQIRGADWLLLNKTDLADAATLARCRRWIASIAPATPCFETVDAKLPAELLATPAGQHSAPRGTAWSCDAPDGHATHEHEHATQFETWQAQPDAVFSAAALRALLKAMPAGVLRLKGWLRTDDHGWAELQFGGRHGALRRALAPPQQGPGVVAIGLRGKLEIAALEQALAQALMSPGAR